MNLEKLKDKLGDYAEFSDNNKLLTIKHPDLPQFRLVFVPSGRAKLLKTDEPYEVGDFFMMQTPVTQEIYEAVTGENPSGFKGKNRPVEQLSWYDSVKFCIRLNDILGLEQPVTAASDDAELDKNKTGFRLPLEAEWEWAAREANAENTKQFAGSDILNEVGWFDKNSNATRPVGLKFPNKLGLYDMSGNVLEWCWDWYEKGSGHVVRGGSWDFDAFNACVSFRIIGTPDLSGNSLGFRLVLPTD